MEFFSEVQWGLYRPIANLLSSPMVLCEVIKSQKYLHAYKIPDPEFKQLLSGLKYRDLKYGDGATVERGDVVNVQYTGRLVGGKEVESTDSMPGRVVTIVAGSDDVVKAVSEGVVGMREYGSRELLATPTMHYVDRFPNSIMAYDVMVRTVVKKKNSDYSSMSQ